MTKPFVKANHDGNCKTETTKIVDGQYNKPANKGSVANFAKPVNSPKGK